MVAVRDFSGLWSSICALASAPAMAPIDSLDRCMTGLQIKKVKADGAGFGALGPQTMAVGLFGVFRDQFLQFRLGALMFLIGGPGAAEGGRQLRPAIGRAHIH